MKNLHVPGQGPGLRRCFILVMVALAVGMSVFSGIAYPDEITIKKFNMEKEIISFLKDHEGFIWVGTINGELIRFDGFDQTVYNLKGGQIPCIMEDDTGSIWTVSDNLGFVRYDKKSDTVTVFGKERGLSSDGFNYSSSLLATDRKGNIWIGTKDGLSMFAPRTNRFTAYRHDPENPESLSHNDVYAVSTDSEGTVWAGTKDGLNRIDPETKTFTVYRHDPDKTGSLGCKSVSAIFIDENILWLGSNSGHLVRFDPESQKSALYTIKEKVSQIISILKYKDKLVVLTFMGAIMYQLDMTDGLFSPFLQDITAYSAYFSKKEGLWGTAGSSIFKEYKPKFTKFPVEAKNPDALKHEGVFPLLADRDGLIWLGYVKEGFGKYDPDADKFIHYGYDSDDETRASHNYVCGIYEDSEGKIWVGTFGGLGVFDKKPDRFVKQDDRLKPIYTMVGDSHAPDIMWMAGWGTGLWKYDRKAGEPLRNYTHDRDMPDTPAGNSSFSMIREKETGILWIAYFDGGVTRFDPSAETFANFTHDPEDENSLSNNAVNSVYEDSEGNIWAATNYGLNKFDRQTRKIRRFTRENGFPADNVFCMEEGDGYLWVATGSGVFKFSPASETVEKIYTKDDGLHSHAFFGSSHAKSADGRIYFGGHNGLNAFYPDEITENPNKPPVVLKSFAQGGESVSLDVRTDFVRTVSLPWNKNFFEFGYVALDYENQEKNRYMYILEGWDKDWYDAGNQRKGRYSGIRGGEYLLRIRGSNNDGVWCRPDQEVALKVVVGSPFWKTGWFYTLCAVSVLGIFGFVFSSQRRIAEEQRKAAEEQRKAAEEQRKAAEQERRTAESLRRMDQLKDEFLANTSHELRTPLSGIVGIADSLIDGSVGPLTEEQRHNLSLIVSSGRRLTNLVNDILDFSKLKKRDIQLRLKPLDMRSVADVVLRLSQTLLGNREIQLVNEIGADLPAAHADENRVQQILHNLVGNAVKFTETGTISVSARVQDKYL
ncbi:two-component regulator propeller domain-containing protein, partial [Desulfobacterales bacterium HSG2]|nr:two-component regulator propeller domain-containing protein [Desulfobacterales bacterium HSG2]